MANVRYRVFRLLERAGPGDRASQVVDLAIMALIVANVVVSIAETVPGVSLRYGGPLRVFEIVSVLVFTVEYAARVWSSTSAGVSPLWGRLRFMASPLLLIDLAAIAPFYLAFLGLDLRLLRLVRLSRFLRIAKLARYSTALQLLGRGVWARKEELALTLIIGAFAIIVSAAFMYYAEHDAQPGVFTSIPAAFWWAITTLTTVGYGDAFPVTAVGKLIGGLVQIIGVGMLALPTAIISASFVEQLGRHRRDEAAAATCPHCGRALEER